MVDAFTDFMWENAQSGNIKIQSPLEYLAITGLDDIWHKVSKLKYECVHWIEDNGFHLEPHQDKGLVIRLKKKPLQT